MNSDTRGLLAIVASVAVFILWYSFIAPRFWPKDEAGGGAGMEEMVDAKKTISAPVDDERQALPIETHEEHEEEEGEESLSTLENDYFKAVFTNRGARLVDWELKTYTRGTGAEGVPVDLVPAVTLPVMPLQIRFEKSNISVPTTPTYRLVEEGDRFLRYAWASKEVVIEKVYTLGENGYDIDLDIIIRNTGASSISGKFSIGWSSPLPREEAGGGFLGFLKRPADINVPVYLLDGKVAREKSPAKTKERKYLKGALMWAGIEDRYFLSAVIPRTTGGGAGVIIDPVDAGNEKGFYAGADMPEETIAPGVASTHAFTVYAGPKEMKTLKKVGMGLDRAIDYGWFAVIAVPILYTLKFLHSIVRNYGIAIILLTIIIKLLMHPISKRSMKSMKEMQKLQPRLKELREKYGSDKQRLNMEMMSLFKAHKVNPMSGCLPMILQLPVYIALYRVLWNSIELYHAPFFWFYKDLSQPDPYFITPLFLGVAMFLQQKLTPSATADPAQQKMMLLMPIMFTAFLAFLPVGLVIYILVNTAMSVVQQWLMKHDMGFRDILKGKIPGRAGA